MLPAETDVTLDRRSAFRAGVGFGGPVGAAVRLQLLRGLGAEVRDKNERVDAVCALPIPHCAGGFLVDAEVGSGGGKLGLGIGAEAKVRSDDFRGTVGTGFEPTIARTWGSPVGTDPGLTYLGPELDLYVLRFGLSLGVLWRVAGTDGASALFSWGLGIGLERGASAPVLLARAAVGATVDDKLWLTPAVGFGLTFSGTEHPRL